MTTTGAGGRAPESRQVEVSEMSRRMKIYAKELDCPIILLSQMSRGIEQRNDHTPLLSDLRESGSIEQDADIVTFLYNPSKYNAALPTNQVILDVKKNRNGPIGGILLEWNGDTTSFKEIGEVDSNTGEGEKPAESTVVDKLRSAMESQSEMKEIAGAMPFDDVLAAADSISPAQDNKADSVAEADVFDDEYEYGDDDAPPEADDELPF